MVDFKPDPGAPVALPVPNGAGADDDVYEDTGDVEFFDDQLPHNPFGSMYLARVPAWLWSIWKGMENENDVGIGTLRQWNEVDKVGHIKPRFKMLLRSDLAAHHGIPKEFALDVTDFAVQNSFVLQESDVPAHKTRSKTRAEAAGKEEYDNRRGSPDGAGPGFDRRKHRFQPYYVRKAIPKKTRIYGRVKHEVVCNPDTNAEFEDFNDRQQQENNKPKSQTIIEGAGNALPPRVTFPARESSNFIKTGPPKPTTKAQRRLQEVNKAARMPENELLDRLIDCFRRYQYWSMKALRQNLNQPEAYLRATLEKVAEMHKMGQFANQWTLKPGMALQSLDAHAAKEAAPSDDDDADLEMEDVV